MNATPPRGQSGSGTGVGRGLSAVRDAIDQMRSPVDRRQDGEANRTDVREAVLSLLSDQPANGYEIVRILGERQLIVPAPGAGAVYPMLQLLADEGLATAEETEGRKTWTLTAAGHAAAEAAQDRPAASEARSTRTPERRGALVRSSAQLAQTAALSAQLGTPQQIAEVIDALDEARHRILSILARE